ncbi:Predicted regulator of rRNA gene transcription (MYB-binding protein) [Ceraceosorus bombacis]|uniref:Predicted regulator of rRNA gene transcription (MYB-binding protein) n=1 Tax=Ceraceosorus bombacis TaxID=401625 RepID=A0A0P1BTD9_9BASI|nr:Predicted regulator of rRNA gene transcription (MYB-binding protein) [Ceraceosorus bombacis]
MTVQPSNSSSSSSSGTPLALFWQLASPSTSERLSSSSKLVSLLASSSSASSSSASSSSSSSSSSSGHSHAHVHTSSTIISLTPDEEALRATQDRLQGALDGDTIYTVKRLIRGLASSRESARIGFSVALSELIAQLPALGSQDVLQLLLSSCPLQKKQSGAEERNSLFARLFGVLALVRSFALLREAKAQAQAQAQVEQSIRCCVQVLLDLYARKSWLMEPSAWVAQQLLQQVFQISSALACQLTKQMLLGQVEDKKGKSIAFQGPDRIAILLSVQSLMEKRSYVQCLAPLTGPTLLSRHNLPALANLLRYVQPAASTGDFQDADELRGASLAAASAAAAGHSRTQPHFVWKQIFSEHFDADARHGERVDLPHLLQIILDDNLFAPTSSSEKKFQGFMVMESLIEQICQKNSGASGNAARLESGRLIGKGFLRSWINALGGKGGEERKLKAAAEKTTLSVLRLVRHDSSTGYLILSQLLSAKSNPPHVQRLVEQLLSSMDRAGVQKYADHLIQLACSADNSVAAANRDTHVGEGSQADAQGEAKSMNAKRLWALDQLLNLIRNSKIEKPEQLVRQVLGFFAVRGWFEQAQAGGKHTIEPQFLRTISETRPVPDFSKHLRKEARSRYISCADALLSHVVLLEDASGKKTRTQGYAASGSRWMDLLVSDLRSIESSGTFVPIFGPSGLSLKRADAKDARTPSERRTTASRELQRLEEVIRKTDDGESQEERLAAVRDLIRAAMLWSWGEQAGEEMLEPLVDCSTRLISPDPAAQPSDASDSADEPTAVELLIDTLVSILELPSAFLRSIVTSVWAAFIPEVNHSGLRLLFNQLGVDDENAATEDAISVDGSAEEELDFGAASSGDDDSEVDEEDDDTSATSQSGLGLDSEDANAEVDPVLRAALELALKEGGLAPRESSKAQQEEGEGDESESDEEEEEEDLLDDDAMLKIDEKLSQIFRERAGAKKEDAEAKREAVAFQLRVLDLLEQYAKRVSSNPLVASMVGPLLQVIQETENKEGAQVIARASSILRNTIAKSKETPGNIAVEELLPVLQTIHADVLRAQSKDTQELLSVANEYLTRCVLSRATDALPLTASALTELYKQTLTAWIDKKNSPVKLGFFANVLKKMPAIALALRDDLFAAVVPASTVGNFRQGEVFSLISAPMAQLAQSESPALAQEGLLYVERLQDFIIDYIQEACAPSAFEPKSDRLKEVLKLGLTAARTTPRLLERSRAQIGSNAATHSLWKTEALEKLSVELKNSQKYGASSALRDLLKQLVSVTRKSTIGKQVDDAGSIGHKEGKKSNSAKRNGEQGASETPSNGAKAGKKQKRQ